ncbi:MAG: phosphotransferase, partial [Euryarchaeota archaeon]|nr:phosphotransferase [Euryarchaeota archaeon]
MPDIDCDFHIHGRYSAATSGRMELETISKQARLKGLALVGTGDALHPGWLDEIKGLAEHSDGIYEKNGCKFVLTTEVEDVRRVHHLILLPSISAAESLRESFRRFSGDIDKDGRPHLTLTGEEVLDYVAEVGGLLGPSHAFVPWTSVYKEYDSLAECYGRSLGKVAFLELGLSADTDMADMIPELADLTFMSNSDAHSPWPHRLGREFNRVRVDDLSFRGLERAILRKGGSRFILNVGLDQRLGKYHRTACIKCFTLYYLKD